MSELVTEQVAEDVWALVLDGVRVGSLTLKEDALRSDHKRRAAFRRVGLLAQSVQVSLPNGGFGRTILDSSISGTTAWQVLVRDDPTEDVESKYMDVVSTAEASLWNWDFEGLGVDE